jgi:hypothetical protein
VQRESLYRNDVPGIRNTEHVMTRSAIRAIIVVQRKIVAACPWIFWRTRVKIDRSDSCSIKDTYRHYSWV